MPSQSSVRVRPLCSFNRSSRRRLPGSPSALKTASMSGITFCRAGAFSVHSQPFGCVFQLSSQTVACQDGVARSGVRRRWSGCRRGALRVRSAGGVGGGLLHPTGSGHPAATPGPLAPIPEQCSFTCTGFGSQPAYPFPPLRRRRVGAGALARHPPAPRRPCVPSLHESGGDPEREQPDAAGWAAASAPKISPTRYAHDELDDASGVFPRRPRRLSWFARRPRRRRASSRPTASASAIMNTSIPQSKLTQLCRPIGQALPIV